VTERNAVLFGQDFGPVTDIQIGPDGGAYVVSIGNETVYRILPEPSALVMMLVGSLAIVLIHR